MTLNQILSKAVARNGCLEYPSEHGRKRYPTARVDGRVMSAQRAVMVLSGIEIPPKMCVLHSCDNPHCINPSHLRLGTHKENMQDKVLRGRARTRPKRSALMEAA